MVQVAATKRTTLYRMLEGSTLETALTESRRESDDHFTVADLTMQQRPARLVSGAITTGTKWANDVKLLTGHAVSLSNSSPGAALLIQDKTGFRAGHVQMAVDVVIFTIAYFLFPASVVAYSLLGAVVLNGMIAFNHRRDRYIAP